ncbi:uncharacterized protein LOC143052085 [Mytilus galloprovincialis]|uniref:uncharacterized protein LOC143052085 n=1 Tax=Mytilus galloprovincialis TaxID=29158 RepID=UPI003F7C962D
MGFPQRPKELNLYPLEERLLSLRIPFMQIRQLPRGGQLSVKGNVVNVPVEVQPTINSLPHTIEKSGTISVKLKKKLEFKKCDFSENVRPFAVICALHYLMRTSDLYKSSGIEINEDWITEIAKINEETHENENNSAEQENDQDQNDSDNDSDHFSEVDESETHVGNTDTLLDHIPDDNPLCDAGLTFAPGEGQRPISLYSDPDAEYLSFPTIFCGQRRPDNKDRSVSVHFTDIVKWELRPMDRRVAQSVPNIFFKLKKIQLKNISDKVNLALRRCQSEGKKWTAKDVLNPNTVNDLVRLDEGYYIFRSLRNSPVYLEKRKKDLFAMIRQLGLPTWFGSLSSADTNWKDLLRILGKLNDGKEYTDNELEGMDWHQKSKLVQKDPQSSVLEKLGPDSTEIESDNDIKRYSRRPKQLENWCLADYVSQLELQYPKTESSDDHETEEKDHESDNENEAANADIIEEINNKIDITLKNGIRIYQRKTPKVIRYVKYNYKTDSENFYRERLMLFYPWRNELSDLQCEHETFENMYLTVARILEKKAKQYEGKVIDLEKAIEEAENDCNENDQIAPATQQVEMEDAEIGPTESEQYVHFNPDRPTEHRLYDMSREVGIEARTVELTNHANRISERDYFDLIRSLNKKQWEFFQHVVTWVKTKHEPFYTFLTGGAGCGKSVVVRTIFQALHRHLCSIEGEDPDDIRILLCAPTGKAAYNINGLTIHNAFQIQPNKGLDQSLSCDVLNTLRMKYRNLSLILIDEISMVGNKMFSLLERRLKKIKGSNCSFGGVSIIAIGDFFQLQPVFDSWIFNDLSKGLTALAPNYWKLLFSFHELTEIMRQKDDLEFAQLLNRLRQNQLTENDFAVLNTRTVSISDPTYRTNATHLFVENALVDNFNLQYISKLGSQKVKVTAVDTVCGDLPASVKTKLLSSLPEKQSDTANLAKEVVLAIGMKYDLTANIEVTDGLTNGSTCELKLIECKTKSIRPSIIWVKFEDARIGANNRRKYSHLFGKDVEITWTPMFDIKRSFTYKYKTFERIQFPLRPAAGKTIHKSQGDTLQEVVVSLKSKRKGKIPHIHYVALSRVTSLTGLQILDLNQQAIAVAECVRQELHRLRTDATLQLCFKPLYNLSRHQGKMSNISRPHMAKSETPTYT